MLTQKYKQQQRQVRVQTSESNYLRGMFYTDKPLAEGYSKVLVNWDVDTTTGKLTPRKGLKPVYYGITNDTTVNAGNHGVLHNAHYTYTTNKQAVVHRDALTTKHILGILREYTKVSGGYYPNSNDCYLANMTINDNEDVILNHTPLFTQRNGYKTTNALRYLREPGIHNQLCKDRGQFIEPVGTFAFDNNYYFFLHTYRASTVDDWKKLDVIPNTQVPYYWEDVYSKVYPQAGNSLQLDETHPLAYGEPGTYYIMQLAGTIRQGVEQYAGKYIIMYYNSLGKAIPWGVYDTAKDTPEEIDAVFKQQGIPSISLRILSDSFLCYTKLGRDIQADETLLDDSLAHDNLNNNQYYVCVVNPQKLNPSEAASWGYNMLASDPYEFECENTAVNNVTILGILAYDEDNKICLTPRRNQKLVLKGYYRAPSAYHSDTEIAKYYATSKMTFYYATADTVYDVNKIYYIYSNGTYSKFTGTSFVTDVTYYEKLDTNPASLSDVTTKYITSDRPVTDYEYGAWCFCQQENKYYMVMPDIPSGQSAAVKALKEFGESKPSASERLAPLNTSDEDVIRVRWQVRHSGASDWIDLTDIKDQTFKLSDYYASHGDHAPFICTTELPAEEVMIRLLITDPLDVTALEEYTLATMTIGLSIVSDELSNTLNLQPVNYNLSTCTGMCEWENRLVVWGVQGALNTIFVSDVNNPTFFPYPNNIDILPEAVRAVYNFGADLLVLTSSALYRLIWDTESMGWTHRLIQQNLSITEADIPMCCVVKNMFFFKSGDAYYMLAPKQNATTSVRGYTNITEVSLPIKAMLTDFHDNIAVILEQITPGKFYSKYFKNNLMCYKAFPANDKIILQYIYNYADAAIQEKYDNPDLTAAIRLNPDDPGFSLGSNLYLNVQLIYSTANGTWSLKVFLTGNMLYTINSSVLQDEQYICVSSLGRHSVIYDFGNRKTAPQRYINGQTIVYNTQFIDIQDKPLCRLVYNETTKQYTVEVHAIKGCSINGVSEDKKDISVIDNYQLLDTGNRDINTDMKKRFREFQFKIKNEGASKFGMYTSFLIDGSLRRDLQKFTPKYTTDAETGEAVIIIERTLDNSLNHITFVPEYKITRVQRVIVSSKALQDEGALSNTTLSTNSTDPDYWTIDESAFPGKTFWKVRVCVSGKGYTPRAVLLSTNLKPFELFGHTWVYRTMNGR